MKILVTGSAGKLGSVTVMHLKSLGHEVIGADIAQSETTSLYLDVRDNEGVDSLTSGFDAIIHTAALHGRHMDMNMPREAFVETNIKGTLNLLNACVKNNVKRFLFTSTTSIYGKAMVDENKAVWVDENLIIQPRDIYDITKQACEELCRDFFEKEGLMTSVYRVGRFLPEEPNLMLNHRLYRGLDERDGAVALQLGVEHDFHNFEIFNVSSGSPFTKADLVNLKTSPEQVMKDYLPNAIALYNERGWSFPMSIDRVYSSSKAENILGYKPKYTFEWLLNELSLRRSPAN